MTSVKIEGFAELSEEDKVQAYRDLKTQHREFRTTVRTVARDWGNRHSLCSQVEEAVREMGLETDMEQISVTGYVPFTVRLNVDAEVFSEMSDEEKLELLKREGDITATVQAVSHRGQIGSRKRFPHFDPNSVRVTTGTFVLEGIENVDPDAPESYVIRATLEGRKAHYWREADMTSSGRATYVRSKCGRQEAYSTNLYDPETQRNMLTRLQWADEQTPEMCKRCAS